MTEHVEDTTPTDDEQVRAAAEKLLARVDAGLMTREEAALILIAAYGDRGQHKDTP